MNYYLCSLGITCNNSISLSLLIGAAFMLFLRWWSPVWFFHLLRLLWLPFQAVLWVVYVFALIHGSILGWGIIFYACFVSLINIIPQGADVSSWRWVLGVFLIYRCREGCQLYAGKIRQLAAWTPRNRTPSKPITEKPPIVSDATSPLSQFLDETAMISNLPPHLQALIQKGKEKRASGGDISDEMM